MEQEVREFLDAHTQRAGELVAKAHLAYWESATTGSEGAADRFARAEAEVRMLYSDRDDFAQVKRWLGAEEVRGPLLQRQLILLALQYAGNQLPPEQIEDLARRAAELQKTFTTFRATLDGVRVSNNQLLDILRTERDGGRRREAWEASKQVAREAAEPLRELVRHRNAAARSLGFPDYYTMGLALQEQEEAQLFRLLEDFRARSQEPFRALRAELDEALARRYGVDPADLRPWHWEDFFGQTAPSVGEVDLDALFQDRDLVAIASGFFAGIGLPVDDVLARSDLFEREGKSQHAFCLDIDRGGDVRVLCNLRSDEHWAMVLLHELGHAVYDKFIPRSLPFLLRTPAHTFATEAVAMRMGRLTRNPEWLRENLGAALDARTAEDIDRQLRMAMLVSARWIPVMVYFERELYRDPDREDLNRLWWDLVEEWQMIRRPDNRDEPDWAAKIHLSNAPVYYHNYLLGELMASQLAAHLERAVLVGGAGRISGDDRVGTFLRERLFAHGAALDWNALLVEATGEGLQPRYFVEQFVRG